VRFYVLCVSGEPGIAPYMVAEVVRDCLLPDGDRSLTSAGSIAGPFSVIATRAELLEDPGSRAALEAWEREDDSEFDKETVLIGHPDHGDPPPRLRLVRPGDTQARDRGVNGDRSAD
jgi:hypothetical protein